MRTWRASRGRLRGWRHFCTSSPLWRPRCAWFRHNGGRERYRPFGARAIYVGRHRSILVVARVVVERIGVIAVRQRKAKPVRGQMRFGGAHQVIDRIGLVSGDRRARRLKAGDRQAIVGAGDPDDLIEAGPVRRVVRRKGARGGNPIAAIAPIPKEQRLCRFSVDQQDRCRDHQPLRRHPHLSLHVSFSFRECGSNRGRSRGRAQTVGLPLGPLERLTKNEARTRNELPLLLVIPAKAGSCPGKIQGHFLPKVLREKFPASDAASTLSPAGRGRGQGEGGGRRAGSRRRPPHPPAAPAPPSPP
jgi:hypothetical protein